MSDEKIRGMFTGIIHRDIRNREFRLFQRFTAGDVQRALKTGKLIPHIGAVADYILPKQIRGMKFSELPHKIVLGMFDNLRHTGFEQFDAFDAGDIQELLKSEKLLTEYTLSDISTLLIFPSPRQLKGLRFSDLSKRVLEQMFCSYAHYPQMERLAVFSDENDLNDAIRSQKISELHFPHLSPDQISQLQISRFSAKTIRQIFPEPDEKAAFHFRMGMRIPFGDLRAAEVQRALNSDLLSVYHTIFISRRQRQEFDYRGMSLAAIDLLFPPCSKEKSLEYFNLLNPQQKEFLFPILSLRDGFDDLGMLVSSAPSVPVDRTTKITKIFDSFIEKGSHTEEEEKVFECGAKNAIYDLFNESLGIRERYIGLLLKYHPDKHPLAKDPLNGRNITLVSQAINTAYEVRKFKLPPDKT